jgi:hypothetical protein
MDDLTRLNSNVHEPVPTNADVKIEAIAKDVFELVRNLLACATLMALGLVARSRSEDLLGGSLLRGVIGWGVIALAAALALLNLRIEVIRLRRWKLWRLWSVVLLVAYVLIALRVLELMALVRLEGK